MPRLRHYARAPFLSRFRLIALLTCQQGRGTLCHVAQRRPVPLLQTGPLENFFSISSPFVSNGRNRADVPLISSRSLLFRLRPQNLRFASKHFLHGAYEFFASPREQELVQLFELYRLESDKQRWIEPRCSDRSHARLIARMDDVSSGQRTTRDWSIHDPRAIHDDTSRPLAIKRDAPSKRRRIARYANVPRVCNYDGSNRDGSGLPGVTGCSLKSITPRCFNIVRCRRVLRVC